MRVTAMVDVVVLAPTGSHHRFTLFQSPSLVLCQSLVSFLLHAKLVKADNHGDRHH